MRPEATLPRGMPSSRWLAVGGFVLVLAAVVGYFVVVFKSAGHLAWVRNDAVPNWLAIALGMTVALLALRRNRGARLPKALLTVDVGLAALFAYFLYVVPAVPVAAGPTVAAAAPDFALRDQNGTTRTLAGFRGSPLLLVFYRGHW
jgi:hypothetical protein